LLVAPTLHAQVAAVGVAPLNSREAAKNALANYKVHARYLSVAQLLNISVTNGIITGELVADLPVQNELYRVEIEGSPDTWSVRKRILGGANNLYVTVTRYDFDAPPDEFWSTALTLRTGYFAVMATRGDNANGLRAPAVLAALRRDLSALSAEAKNRLDLFLANHSNMLLDDPRAPLTDGAFLLDCLDDDDAAVRAAGKAALEKLIAKPIEFDLT